MHVVGLLEDDGAERLVGEVELRHVDVDELEAARRQPVERLLDPGPDLGAKVGIFELAP